MLRMKSKSRIVKQHFYIDIRIYFSKNYVDRITEFFAKQLLTISSISQEGANYYGKTHFIGRYIKYRV